MVHEAAELASHLLGKKGDHRTRFSAHIGQIEDLLGEFAWQFQRQSALQWLPDAPQGIVMACHMIQLFLQLERFIHLTLER